MPQDEWNWHPLQKASWSFSEARHSGQKICILPLSLNQRNECPWYVIVFQTLLSCFSFLLPASPREPIPLLLYCRIPQPKVASFYNNNPDLEVIINHLFNPIASEVFKVTSPRPCICLYPHELQILKVRRSSCPVYKTTSSYFSYCTRSLGTLVLYWLRKREKK